MFWVRNPSDPDDDVDVAYVRDLWLDKEWSKFRNGTLISLVSSGALFIVVVWLLFRTKLLHLGFIDFILLIFAGLFLGYSIYAIL